jgi:4-hydroxy-2-oxoheptanedioate aldolase
LTRFGTNHGIGSYLLDFVPYRFRDEATLVERIKQRLAAGKSVNVFVLTAMPAPALVEIAAMHGGFHGVWIDQEHAAATQERIEALALACRAAGLDSFVRLAPTDYTAVMRPLEAGVGGIMAAQIQSAVHAKEVVAWAKFPPEGRRGVNMNNREGRYGNCDLASVLRDANRDRWIAVQIETLSALKEVDDIAAIDGVDHLFVGPADLSTALGVPGEFLHAKVIDGMQAVADAARRHGKTWGILCRGPEHAEKARSMGCSLFALATEFGVVHAGFKAVKENYKGFFE